MAAAVDKGKREGIRQAPSVSRDEQERGKLASTYCKKWLQPGIELESANCYHDALADCANGRHREELLNCSI